jgi:hypothetical protein
VNGTAFELKPLLKRGALVVAANWPVIVLQWLAEAAFKLLLTLPALGAAFLIALVAGGSAVDLAGGDLRRLFALAVSELGRHPAALTLYVVGAAIVVVGGAAITFLVKGGTVAVLVAAEARAPAIERLPLMRQTWQQAAAFTLRTFRDGCARLFDRYLLLGLALLIVYGAMAIGYLAAIYFSFRLVAGTVVASGWTFLAALISIALVLGVTVVNLIYLLVQIVIAAEDASLLAAARRVAGFVRAQYRTVGVLFAAMLVLVGLATAASILATASLGFIGFVPIIGLAVLPLQLAAWLARGLVFQYLGLTGLTAYVRLYRGVGRALPARAARERATPLEHPA